MFNKKIKTMKNHVRLNSIRLMFFLFIIVPLLSNAQNKKSFIDEYLTNISINSVDKGQQRYRMTAIYTNRDLYGNFIDKTKITGDYTRGLENEKVKWNNVYVSGSRNIDAPFDPQSKQEYMENMTYVPSAKMLDAASYTNFPPTTESVFSRNLIWDTMAIEGFAWDHLDSLKLNRTYRIPNMKGEFDMADIGSYEHAEILLNWTGITAINEELYAVIEYEAIDNIVSISMGTIKTKGTEQYWGTILVSLDSREIGQAVMYSGSIQEIEIAGMENKIIIKTIRELWLEKL